MSDEIKKIEELEGFKNMRIVDNFYQTSSFFPMPTIEVSTIDEIVLIHVKIYLKQENVH